jgi:phosphoribosylformylglycinamidine synthase subunit PurQ / glutaminase
MKTAVIVFPGSNCDRDIGEVLKNHYNHNVDYIWHKNSLIETYDLVIVPGGFSYGDYLRCGAIARFSNAMKSLTSHISAGRKILGICNGFQILTEAGLLPGTLMRNKNLKHICKNIYLKKGSHSNKATKGLKESDILELPISHSEGNYYIDDDSLKILEDENRILLRYAIENPNGSIDDIAGVTSKDFNTIGLMPHPERAMDEWSSGRNGKILFDSIFQN